MTTAIHRCKTCNTVTRVEYRRQMNSIGYGRKEAAYFRESDGAKHVQPVECDARCTHAKGFNCECSCGGENHGKGGMFTQLLEAA